MNVSKNKSSTTMNLKRILTFSDITSLTLKSKLRAKNDAMNSLRENILSTLHNLPNTYLEDPIYGSQWNHLQNAWKRSIESLCILPYDRYTIEPKGGRCYNYDFLAHYYKDDKHIDEKKIEFKHNCKQIDRLPQFLSLSTKVPFFEKDYAEYYYENYLPEYLKLDTELTPLLPDKETYLKYVHTTNYDAHPLFRSMYERETISKKEKQNIVDQSIQSFLSTYGASIQTSILKEKLETSQENKYYLLWDLQHFHIDQLTSNDFLTLEYSDIKNKNTIILKTPTCEFHLLLRWRNHKGILMPAWQISLKNRNQAL